MRYAIAPLLILCLFVSGCGNQKPEVLRNKAYDSAMAALANGEVVDALKHIDRAIELDAGAAHLHQVKGTILVHLQEYPDALVSYDRAYQLNSKSAEATLGAGFALKMMKREREAEDRFALAQRHYTRRLENPPDPEKKSDEYIENAIIDAKLHLALIAALRGEKASALLLIDRIEDKHPTFDQADRWRDIIESEGFDLIFTGQI